MVRLSHSVHELLTEDVLNALCNKKIFTITEFLDVEGKMLTKITNLSYKEILDVKKQILNTFSAKIHNGFNYYNHLLQNTTITSTNIANLDSLLGGGLRSGNIYEFCGFSATGKTQLCVTIALNTSQYLEKYVYYIDTKYDFSARKLQNILNERKLTEEISGQILEQIKVKQISDQYELISSLYDIKNELAEGLNCPIIIIDSLPAVFYHTGNYNNTITIINHFVNIMRHMAIEMNVAFVVTNIMIQDNLMNPDEATTVNYKPGLGTYWLTVPNTRILLDKNDESTCTLTVSKSTTVENGKQCIVTITECGVQ